MSMICLLISMLVDVANGQFMGYPYDYSSMFSGYAGYNPMMNMGSMGLSNGFGTFGTGMENLYGAQNAFAGAYNPYGNGLFNFGYSGNNAGMFGDTSSMFNGGLTTANSGLQQMLQPAQNLFSPQNTMAPPTFAPIQQQQQQQQIGQSSLNNGNTLRAYGRRTQNFNNYAPTRVGQGGCNGGFGGCGNQNGWQTKAKV